MKYMMWRPSQTHDKQARQRGGVEYLVKWLDYGEEENTWEPGASLDNPQVRGLIDAFHTKRPNTYHPGEGAGH